MSRLIRTPVADMPEKQQVLYEQMLGDREAVADGEIGGPFDGWGRSPSSGRRAWQLGGTIRFRSTIDRRYVELAILMTGHQWQAQYEWWAHEPMAREAGLPEDVIQAIKAGVEPSFTDDSDEGDRICWRFCRTLIDREKVDDALYAATVERFGESGVQDLIFACGFYTLVSMTLNTFEVQLPEGAVAPFPT